MDTMRRDTGGTSNIGIEIGFLQQVLNELAQGLRCQWIVSTFILFYVVIWGFFSMKSCKNKIQESIELLAFSHH